MIRIVNLVTILQSVHAELILANVHSNVLKGSLTLGARERRGHEKNGHVHVHWRHVWLFDQNVIECVLKIEREKKMKSKIENHHQTGPDMHN